MYFLIVSIFLISIFLTVRHILKIRSNRAISYENRPNRVFHEVACPICLDNKSYPVMAFCAHEFCANCILSSLEKWSTCPICKQEIIILFKNFQECPEDLRKRLRIFSGSADDRTYFEIFSDTLFLFRRFFTHNDYHSLILTIVYILVLTAVGIVFILLPSDKFDESNFGWLELVDSFGLLSGTALYAMILILRAILY